MSILFSHRLTEVDSDHASLSCSRFVPAGSHQGDAGELWSVEILSQHRDRNDHHEAWKVGWGWAAEPEENQPGRRHRRVNRRAPLTSVCLCVCFRRMFPHCNVSITGLQPFANYVVMMDMVPVESFKYKVSAQLLVAGLKPTHCRETLQSGRPDSVLPTLCCSLAYQSSSLLPVCALTVGGVIN